METEDSKGKHGGGKGSQGGKGKRGQKKAGGRRERRVDQKQRRVKRKGEMK